MEVRSQEKSLSLRPNDAYKCPCCSANESRLEALGQKFLYKFRKTNEKPVFRDDVVKLLKVFYQAVGDASYNEYTIFYWDCSSTRKSSPKGMLDDFVIQDTKHMYEYYKDCLLYDLEHLKGILQIDRKIVDSILGKAFHPHFSQLQTMIIQEILGEKISRAVDEVERHGIVGSNGLENLSNRSNCNGIVDINLKDAFRVLNIKEDIQKRITKNNEKKRKIIQTLLRDFKLFNTYLYYIKEEHENIEIHTRGIDEIKDHRFLRGFSIVEDKFDRLFDLIKEVTIEEIRKIGLDGRDLKEKLESLDDRLVFL